MNPLITVLVGSAVTLAGGFLSFAYALRLQRISWEREEKRRIEQREYARRIEFTVDVQFIAVHDDRWLVALIALIENKGFTRHSMKRLDFELRSIHRDDRLVQGDATIGGQTLIPHVIQSGSWLPTSWESTVIEPGLKTEYSFVASVPMQSSAVLLHAIFEYGEEQAVHTAERLMAVPSVP
jgi:hypothetical protein